MKGGIRVNEKAFYRVANAGLLICMVLFGAERFLGIGGLDIMHLIVAFAVVGIMAGINYMPGRGRILCAAAVCVLLCAGLAAGPAGTPDFWRSFFPWLVGRGAAPPDWQAGYGLLQTALYAAGCYLVQILFGKLPPLRTVAAVSVSCLLAFCLLSGREMNRWGVAFMACFILIAWEEGIQKRWEKRRKRYGSPAHTFWILPFLALYLVLLAMMPVQEEPYDWLWAKNMYNRIKESVLAHTQNIRWGGREGFGMAFTGFSGEADLGGDLQEDMGEVMQIRVWPASIKTLYLTGAVYDSFDGRGWSLTGGGCGDAALLDTARTLYAVKNYNGLYQQDYLKEIRVDIRYGDFLTGYLFAPLKTWSLEEGEDGGSPDYVCRDGALSWNGKRGYGTEYRLRFFGMNAGTPQFALFLEEAAGEEGTAREVWEEVMAQCARHGGRTFTPEDLEEYRQEVYGLYLGQVGLSEEMEAYLEEITGSAETDLEKLRAIERALSGLRYTLTPGELPEKVADAGGFLDYFVLETGQGYCTYFATAFVLLARAEGIPARYVQGYCVPIGDGGEARVRSDMAHAWPEAYMEGVGWIPFEPTPGYGKGRYETWEVRQAAEDMPVREELVWAEEPESVSRAGEAPDADEEEAEAEPAQGYSWGLFGYAVMGIVSACGIILAIDNRLGRYRYGKMEPEEKLKMEVFRNLKLLSWFGPKREEWETLEEFGDRIAQLPGLCDEGMEPPLDFLKNYEQAVYGRGEVGENIISDTVKEGERILGLLRRERKWAWYYCRIRRFLGRYRL